MVRDDRKLDKDLRPLPLISSIELDSVLRLLEIACKQTVPEAGLKMLRCTGKGGNLNCRRGLNGCAFRKNFVLSLRM